MTYRYCEHCGADIGNPTLRDIKYNNQICGSCDKEMDLLEDRIFLLCEYIENLEENFNNKVKQKDKIMTDNHTPLPWTIKDKKGKYHGSKTKFSIDYNGKFFMISSIPILGGSTGSKTIALAVSKDEPQFILEQNAAFIVKACNNHEKLVDMVKNLLPYAISRRDSGNAGTLIEDEIEQATALIKELENS